MQRLLGIAIKAAVLGLLITVGGCSTMTWGTQYYDATYSEPLTKLNLLLIPNNFPDNIVIPAYRDIGKPAWYEKVAQRMEQNFLHNGIPLELLHARKESPPEKELSPGQINPLQTVPTLLLYPQELYARSGLPLNLTIHARLLIPGRTKPVWEAQNCVSPDFDGRRAGDELSLKILNELAKLGLAALSHAPAETIDGEKGFQILTGGNIIN